MYLRISFARQVTEQHLKCYQHRSHICMIDNDSAVHTPAMFVVSLYVFRLCMRQCVTVCSSLMYKWNQILLENLLFLFILISQMYLSTNCHTFISMVMFWRANVELVSSLLPPFPTIIHHTLSSREAHTCSIPII